MSIEIRGLEELSTRLEDLTAISNVRDALKTACALVEREAKKKAPKGDTGELRNSITYEVEDYEGVVFTPKEYAPYVEYGTGLFAENGGRQDVPWRYQDDKGEWHTTCGQPPHPFMRPALLENREKIVKLLKEGILDG